MYNKYIKMDAIIKLQNEIIKDKEELLKLMKKKIEQQQAEELETIPEINNLIEITTKKTDFVYKEQLKNLIKNNNLNITLKKLRTYLKSLDINIKDYRKENKRVLIGFKIL